MRHSYDIALASSLYVPASEETCRWCGRGLRICEHRIRFVQRSDDVYRIVRQLKWCPYEGCQGYHKTYSPLVDLRLALPHITYGTDIILELVGERHLSHSVALAAIGRDFTARGIPMSQTGTCNLFRAYVALTKAARGDDEEVRTRLRAQGGIVLMADGVQFDSNSPVLYLVWDAISGEPLFGERKLFRGADDLVPLLKRVKAMGVPILAAVSDKETGLLPAIAEVFPDAPHQLCQIHFLKNCALGMADDLQDLGESVSARAEKVQKIAKRLHERGFDSIESEQRVPDVVGSEAAGASGVASSVGTTNTSEAPPKPAPLSEEQLATELCAMARHASRATGRAPLNPPEHVRHSELEGVRAAVQAAKKKEGEHPLLNKLDKALTPGWHGDRAAGRVSRHLELLRDVAREITPNPERDDPPADGDEAHERLLKLLDRAKAEAPRSGLGAATGEFVDHLAGLAERYGRQLFHCYDDPRIPSTNNRLEGFFGASKSHIRAALAAASTTNGVAHNLGADYLEAFSFTRAHTHAELLAIVDSIDIPHYEAARRRVETNESRPRLRRSRRRDPMHHLAGLINQWFESPAQAKP